jgi:hypothetical protein
MAHEQSPLGPKPAWAYAYQIVPPQPEDRLRAVKVLLDHEGAQARVRERTWEGRFVVEQQVTHILVVSDSPDQDLEVNQRLEEELRGLEAGFALTVPMAVAEEPVPPAEPVLHSPHLLPGRPPPRE